MNWLTFTLALIGAFGVYLLWKGVDSGLKHRAPRLRLLGSGALGLAIAVPAVWFLPNQSNSILFGAVAGFYIAGAFDAVQRRRSKSPAVEK